MNVVVVESPAKAKTINKYLGSDYEVLASFGHVRDLPSKDGSVRPDEDFAMTYQVEDDSKRHVTAIAKALKGSHTLYLATDPDREGEAISWHVLEALKESKSLPKSINVKRIVFHEITKKAVTDAITHARDIDMDLVNAQQARRALDYLVGFTLSPVLWRKLPGSKSAGRVQSVALRLICERDVEIEKFISEEYWDIRVALGTAANAELKARLTHWQNAKLEKFSIPNEAKAQSITASLRTKQFTVTSVEPKEVRRHPYAPFTTSTLQQEASRKLGFSAKKTMQLAQKLYEGIAVGGETTGLITYMRTDGVTVSQEAITAARALIGKQYGAEYVPSSQRMYKVKTSNAQEAHEAVRPTDVTRLPQHVKSALDNDMFRLYDLIWKRMIASQMESAVYDQVGVDFLSTDKEAQLRATGSVVKFDGFLTLYTESNDDGEDEEQRRLPAVKPGETMVTKDVLPEQHFTEPPPRYTEASLVKKLEELGIGRPSTYASIISVLQDRGYVKLEKKRFTAESRGQLVTAFLSSFFERYVQYDFTAQLENKLDDVAEGNYDWKQLLRDFWQEFHARIDEGKKLTGTEVIDAVEKILEPFIFQKEEGKDPRACPTCGTGRLGLKLGRFGAFLGCSSYPECNYTKPLAVDVAAEGEEQQSATGNAPRTLGQHPQTSHDVLLKKGPYGWYVETGTEKPFKRASLKKTTPPDSVTLDMALAMLALPRDVGAHPETRKMISAGVGRFGPYLLHDGKYTSLKEDDDPVTIGINRAVTLLSETKKYKGAEALRNLGNHPEDGNSVEVFEGRYGPYVKHGKVNATIPKGTDPEHVTLEEAIKLLETRANAAPKKGRFGKKAPAAKAAPKVKPAVKAKTPARTTTPKTAKKAAANSVKRAKKV